ncbi:pepsin/retropepsin-like aspartic protease family protein [Aquimarina algiphila]|uniref:aspartyl protease family protein n=1 Tax=Aquimarina algiphila TaxID=2047982 RepID=UPI002330CBB5|nr:aspartyl protease family protein [Aquimarina algiphila]
MYKITPLTFLLFFIPCISLAQEHPIHIMEEGHIVVQVQLSDSIMGNFILDTGAGVNVLSGKMFKKIASQAVKKGYFTGFRHDGDRLDGEIYEIPYLAIGKVKQTHSIVGVYPPLDAMGIDGLLSLKFFENKAFSIDFKNHKIAFVEVEMAKSLAKKHTTVPIELYKHTNVMLDIFIPITLNDNTTVLAEFDTGSGYDAYMLNPGYIDDLKLNKTELSTQKYKTQLSGEERIDSIYTLNSISVGKGNKEVKKNEVTVIFRKGMIYNALIGSGLFKNNTITIDIPNRTFIIQK